MADDEEIQEEVTQEEEQVVEETEERAEEQKEETLDTAEEIAEDETKKGFVGRYWMLGLGFLMAIMGVVAIIGLRTNFIQVYLLGYSDPSPGIGSQEYMGYGIASIPYALGILMVVVWGRRTPELPDMAGHMDDVGEAEPEETAAETEVDEPAGEPEEFGHEHLPAHHLSAIEKIEHLTKVYAQGKMSEGLYKENLARFEAELENGRAEAKKAAAKAKLATAPAQKPAATQAPAPVKKAEPAAKQTAYQELKSLKPEVATNEEDHLPPHHLSPEEKIEHLTKSYGQGKVSRPFFDKNLKKFEVELKREQEYLPPHELHPRQKLEQLEDAFQMGVISKSTYDKNKKVFQAEAESTNEEVPELEFKSEVVESDSLDDDLDSLLKEVNDDDSPKPDGKRKKTLMEELEDLEDL
jgi:cell division septation protein DedD